MSSKSLLLAGFAVCNAAAVLMVLDVVDVGWGAAIGMVGVGLVGASSTTSRRATN